MLGGCWTANQTRSVWTKSIIWLIYRLRSQQLLSPQPPRSPSRRSRLLPSTRFHLRLNARCPAHQQAPSSIAPSTTIKKIARLACSSTTTRALSHLGLLLSRNRLSCLAGQPSRLRPSSSSLELRPQNRSFRLSSLLLRLPLLLRSAPQSRLSSAPLARPRSCVSSSGPVDPCQSYMGFFVYGVWDIIGALGGADWIRCFVYSLQGLSRAVAIPVRPPPRLEGFY